MIFGILFKIHPRCLFFTVIEGGSVDSVAKASARIQAIIDQVSYILLQFTLYFYHSILFIHIFVANTL